MKLEIFGKKRTNKEGKPFTTYLSRLTNMKTGEIIPVQVKFRMDVRLPEKLPIIANVNKQECNLVHEEWANDETGETGIKNVLWISEVEAYENYVDHSMDDYE